MGRPGSLRSFAVLGAALLALGVSCAGRSVGEGERGTAGGSGGSRAGATGGSDVSGGTSGTAGIAAGGGATRGGTSAGGATTGGTSAGGTGSGGTSAGATSAGGGTRGIEPPNIATCGNGTHDELEECDDGNKVTGDGCSGDCSAVERGWVCPGDGLPCRPRCGDAMLVGAEECDDGNDLSGDGCSRACRVEHPLCAMDLPAEAGAAGAPGDNEPPAGDAGARVACVTPVCGDGVVTAPEDCDDGAGGNDSSYGGCTADCAYAPFCGDGIVNGPEQCDDGPDGVRNEKGGCASTCRRAAYCGDGIVDSALGEECDDGDGNGVTSPCRADCTVPLR